MLSKEWLQGCKMMADAGVMFQSDAVKSLLDHIAELEENATAQALALKAAKAMQQSETERADKAEADCNHWKANHENQVLRARILMERPDMPIERVKAYRRMQELEALADANQAKIDALMFEYCPDEMTDEQRHKWAISQAVSKLTKPDIAALIAISNGEDLPNGK